MASLSNPADFRRFPPSPVEVVINVDCDDQTVAGIPREQTWRTPPTLGIGLTRPSKGLASRWTDPGPASHETQTSALPDHYTVALAMRRTNASISVGGGAIHSGDIASGMSHVTSPGEPVSATFRLPCDFIHLFLPKSLMEKCCAELGVSDEADPPRFPPHFQRSAAVEQLIRSLATIPPGEPATAQLYIEGVSLAVAAQLLLAHRQPARAEDKPKIPPLPKWRLKRALDFIEANIAEPITLPALAESAGLTRMYFAAQFRTATGLRPHEFVLRRRIERAQDMLLTSNITLMDASFNTGFQTQAHFTTVFKKLVGQTPNQWREAHRRHIHIAAATLKASQSSSAVF
jgi:AraC-like DNA-binding protein